MLGDVRKTVRKTAAARCPRQHAWWSRAWHSVRHCAFPKRKCPAKGARGKTKIAENR